MKVLNRASSLDKINSMFSGFEALNRTEFYLWKKKQPYYYVSSLGFIIINKLNSKRK